jgi:hypothetical protein
LLLVGAAGTGFKVKALVLFQGKCQSIGKRDGRFPLQYFSGFRDVGYQAPDAAGFFAIVYAPQG